MAQQQQQQRKKQLQQLCLWGFSQPIYMFLPYLRIEDAMNQKYEEPLERVKDGEEILEHDGGAVYSQ